MVAEDNGTGSNRTWPLALLGIAAISAMIRVPALDRASFWWDECVTVRLAQYVNDASPLILLNAVSRGLSTYFLLLAPWVRWTGTTETAVRFPSVLAGVALSVVLALVGREIGGRALGVKLGILAAISPWMVWHSREARWYALTVFLVACGLLCFARLWREWHWGWAAGCFVAGLAAASTYSPAITILIVQIVWLGLAGRVGGGPGRRWLQSSRGKRTAQALITGLLVLLAAGWLARTLLLPALAGGAKGFGFHNLGGPRLGAVAYTGIAHATGYTLGPGPSEWHLLDQVGLRTSEVFLLVLGTVAFLGLMSFGARRIALERGRLFAVALFSLVVVPSILVIVASWWTEHSYAPRYVAFTYPVALVLAAAGLQRLRVSRPAFFMGAIVIILQAVSLWNLHFEERYLREDIRAAARHVAERASTDDLILLFGGIKLPWEHYYAGPATWRMIYSTGQGAWSEDRLRERLASQTRVWVVQARMWADPDLAKLVSVVDSWAPPVDRSRFAGNVIVSSHHPDGGRLDRQEQPSRE